MNEIMTNGKRWTKSDITDQSGKVIMVTGANIGIGYETAKALYEAGARVIVACRNGKNAEEAIATIKQSAAATGALEPGVVDLSDLKSIKTFAESFLTGHQQLDVLINNAGVATPPARKTSDGFELQFGTNFLGHFALTGYLYPLLRQTMGARVISLGSMAYLHGAIDFDNLRSEKSYDPMREYCQSKLATTIFGVELQRRISAAGDRVLSLIAQPGANSTGLARHMTAEELATSIARVGVLMEPWQGALPSLYAATMPSVTAGGFYQPDQDGGYRGYPVPAVLKDVALDERVNKKLWAFAEHVTGISFPG